ncbi:MAG: GH3 auxin-responsive promoter family protein [Elusimicrobia bacterium]|nr:GH3 auxin-responsive promoter family protein [Elusimicrobiota bacterium]
MRRVLLELARAAALLAGVKERLAFERALRDPRKAQDAVLARVLKSLSETSYGRERGLKPEDDYASFAAKLPIVDYDALKPYVEEQKSTEASILFEGSARFYERTSGSSGGSKDIPYGDRLWSSFQRAFSLWLGDLLLNGPRLKTGRCWISVSPWAEPGKKTAKGVRIGLDDDGEYVKGWLGKVLRLFWTVPSAVRHICDPDEYKLAVATYLLADAELEIVSVWNPTLFLLMLDTIVDSRDVLLKRLAQRGTGAARLDALCSALSAPARKDVDWGLVWPELKLISSWDMAEAARPAAALAALFPHASFQGKGHLATESPVTIPWIDSCFCLPLVDSVFFEFADASGKILRLHELKTGAEYDLIVTPEGGFARYRLGDRVLVTDRHQATPALALAGRCDDVCDLAGEKLDARFVTKALDTVCPGAAFRTLVPVHEDGRTGRYALVLDHGACSPEALDEALRLSPLYDHARSLGQLSAPTVSVRPDAAERFGRFFAARGARWGGVKQNALVRDPEHGRELARSLDL